MRPSLPIARLISVSILAGGFALPGFALTPAPAAKAAAASPGVSPARAPSTAPVAVEQTSGEGTGLAISGRATGPGGAPIIDARVLLLPEIDRVAEWSLAETGGLPETAATGGAGAGVRADVKAAAESRPGGAAAMPGSTGSGQVGTGPDSPSTGSRRVGGGEPSGGPPPPPGSGPNPRASAVTNAEGLFFITAPGAGLWRVRIESPGFVSVEYPLEPLVEAIDLPDVEMTPDAGFAVKVVGSDGKPLPGARVRLSPPSGRDRRGAGSGWTPAARTALTGPDGTARLSRGENERFDLAASAPGHLVARRSNPRGTATSLPLEPGAPRTIEVRAADGSPAPGVLVVDSGSDQPLVVTDAAGRALLAVPPKGETRIDLVASDGRQLEARISPAPPEATPPVPPRVLSLPERGRVIGRVIDLPTRRPLRGALVWIDAEPWAAATTDTAGGFTLAVPAGRGLDLTAAATGYLRTDPLSYDPASDSRSGPVLALRPAAAVEGSVVDPSGRPVAGARLGLEIQRPPGDRVVIFGRLQPGPRAVSTSRGHFRITGIDPKNPWLLTAQAKGFASTRRDLGTLEPRRTRADVRVEMTPGRLVTGRIVDGAGKPIAQATVALRAAARGPHEMVLGAAGAGQEAEGRAPSVTDADGSFRIAGIGEGSYEVEVRRRGFATKTVGGIEVAKGAISAVDTGTIVLVPGTRVSGNVVDSGGAPIEGAEIEARKAASAPVTVMRGGPRSQSASAPDAITDPRGWFTIEDLEPGSPVGLTIRRTGFVPVTEPSVAVPSDAPLQITMQPASKVSGTVLTADRKPVAGASVRLRRQVTGGGGGAVFRMISMSSVTADTEGRFLFESQEPGEISLSATAPGWQEVRIDALQVPKGADLDGVDLTLQPGAIVRGRVLAPDGRPAVGAEVGPVSGEGDAMPVRFRGAVTDGDGYYSVEGLPVGPASIEASHDDFVRTVKEVDVKAGVNRLDLQFEGGASLAGTVVDASGAPVAGAFVHLEPGRSWGEMQATSGADGSFKIEGVGAGDYLVRAARKGFAPSGDDTRVHVETQSVEGVRVTLRTAGSILGQVRGLDPDQIAGLDLRAFGPDERADPSANVDRSGAFRFDDLGPGRWVVLGTLPSTGRQARAEATLEDGGREVRVDLEFGGGLKLTGHALLGDQPVKGADILATGIDVTHSGRATTGPDGAFAIEGLDPGSYTLELRQWQSGLSHDETVEVRENRDVTIHVPTAHLVGRVVDSSDRQPVAGATIVFRGPQDPARQPLFPLTATTDQNGRFEFDNATDGDWNLTANKNGYAAGKLTVTVQQQKDLDDLSLALDPTEGLALDVRLAAGRAPDQAQVAVLDPSGAPLVAGTYATGENGRIRLASVPPGTWDVLVKANGSGVTNLRAASPGPPLGVALPPASTLAVRVPGLAGSTTIGQVSLTGPDGRPFRDLSWFSDVVATWPIAAGGTELDGLPPGDWTVEVKTADGRSWRGQATTTAGVKATVTLK